MGKQLRTMSVSSRKNVTLDLNNGCEITETPPTPPPPPPPPPSPPRECKTEPRPVNQNEEEARDATNDQKGKEEKVQCNKCQKMVSSRCLRYYHVCREVDPVARRATKKKAKECETVAEPVATTKIIQQETVADEGEQPTATRTRRRCESSVVDPVDERLKSMQRYVEARRATRSNPVRSPVDKPRDIYDRLFE